MAALLLADPAPQLLMLDEPTNNLDLASVDQLVSTLTPSHHEPSHHEPSHHEPSHHEGDR